METAQPDIALDELLGETFGHLETDEAKRRRWRRRVITAMKAILLLAL